MSTLWEYSWRVSFWGVLPWIKGIAEYERSHFLFPIAHVCMLRGPSLQGSYFRAIMHQGERQLARQSHTGSFIVAVNRDFELAIIWWVHGRADLVQVFVKQLSVKEVAYTHTNTHTRTHTRTHTHTLSFLHRAGDLTLAMNHAWQWLNRIAFVDPLRVFAALRSQTRSGAAVLACGEGIGVKAGPLFACLTLMTVCIVFKRPMFIAICD